MDSFNPQPKPGAGRIKDSKLLQYIKQVIGRCEWQFCESTDQLAAHHIFGRGSGGSKRDDRPEGVAVLCLKHHTEAHTATWWNYEGQQAVRFGMMMKRDKPTWERLAAYGKKGSDISGGDF